MRTPTEAYREGYEKGKADSLAGQLGQAMFGLLDDDPGGHFASGYRDGAGGIKFAPPPDNVRKADAELNPFDDKVAIKTVCPNCGELDWFEWKFLGRLTDPVCGHGWYVGSGTYALMQLRAAFGAGRRFSKYMTSGISGEGAWIGRALGWCLGTLLGLAVRLEIGLLMIPIQAIAGLCQPRKNTAEIISRSIVATVFVLALAVLAYTIHQESILRSGIALQPNFAQSPVVQSPQPDSSQVASPQVNMAPDTIGLFALAPDYTDHWKFAAGPERPDVAYVDGHLQVRARPVSGSWARFNANIGFDDADITFTYNHQGFGRTTVGLWSFALNDWQAWADLDTDDTPCLYLNSRDQPNASICPSDSYLNRNLALRIQTLGNKVIFYADDGVLNSFTLSGSGSLAPAIAVSSVNWKRGDNVTTFYGVSANYKPAPVESPPVSTAPEPEGAPLAISKSCDDLPNMRSTLSRTPATLVLRNTTSLQLGIFWIDFDGHRQEWGGVNPGQDVTEHTYIGHPWLLVDVQNQCHGLFLPAPGESVAIAH